MIPAADQSSALIHRLLTAKHTTTTVAFNEVSAKASELLLNKGFNQSDEYDADMAAIFYLKNTGYAPSSYIDVINACLMTPQHIIKITQLLRRELMIWSPCSQWTI